MSNHISLNGAVALVTGANRGIGAAFVTGLLDAGAQRVYAAARNPQTLATLVQSDARVAPVTLDISDDTSVQEAARRLVDVNLVVNNAGALLGARLLAASDLSAARQEMEVNYFGLLRMCRAFAPILAINGGGMLINVLSILSRMANPAGGGYSASKAAALSLTQSVRAELQAQGTRVIGVMPGFVDTEMAAGITDYKIQPSEVVRAAFDALQTDQDDVYPGEQASQIAAMLLQDPKMVERRFAQSVAA